MIRVSCDFLHTKSFIALLNFPEFVSVWLWQCFARSSCAGQRDCWAEILYAALWAVKEPLSNSNRNTSKRCVYYCFSSPQLIPVSQRCLSITLITKHSFKSNKIKKHSTMTPNLIPDKSVMHQMLLPSGCNDTWLSLVYHCTDMFTPPKLLTRGRRKGC